MGDLFLHLPFARRLRYADGLHPLACEALVRRSPLVTLGGALPDLPLVAQKSGGLLSRIFKRGKGDAHRWQEILSPSGEPKAPLLVQVLSGSAGKAPGPMGRLALGLGLLSHHLLAEELEPLYEGLDPATRSAVERGQARLWLQFAVPAKRDLEHEWAPALAFHELESHKPVLDHLERALLAAYGQSPGRDTLAKWTRGLFQEITPLLEKGGMPEAGAVPDHTVKSKYYDGEAHFLDRAQTATTRFVFLAGRIAERFLQAEPDEDQLAEALCGEGTELLTPPSSSELETAEEKWRRSIGEARAEVVTRGRNPKAAFQLEGDLMSSLPELPPLPDDAEDSASSPTVTQEVSLAQIEAEMSGESSGEGQAVPGDQEPAGAEQGAEQAPAGEGEAAELPPAPTSTQQISAVDIESESAEAGDEAKGAPPPPPPETTPPPAPANTQQISAADIEAEVQSAEGSAASSADSSPSAGEFQAPANTQQISAADIETEVQSGGSPPPPPEDTESAPPARGPEAPSAPASTQQISAADIEAEMAAQSTPEAPAHTQQISAADIEAEVQSAEGGAGETAPESAQTPSAPEEAAAEQEQPADASAAPAPEQPPTQQPPPVQPSAVQPPAEAAPADAQPPSFQPPPLQPPAPEDAPTEPASPPPSHQAPPTSPGVSSDGAPAGPGNGAPAPGEDEQDPKAQAGPASAPAGEARPAEPEKHPASEG